MAESLGMSKGEILRQDEAVQVANDMMDDVNASWSDIFLGFRVGAEPEALLEMYVHGTAPESLRERVDQSRISIKIVDNQPFSKAELWDRMARVDRSFRGSGFSDVTVDSPLTNSGVMDVVAYSPTEKESAQARAQDVVANLPDELEDWVRYETADVPLSHPHSSAFGGMSVIGDRRCTSSWSVFAGGVGRQASCRPLTERG